MCVWASNLYLMQFQIELGKKIFQFHLNVCFWMGVGTNKTKIVYHPGAKTSFSVFDRVCMWQHGLGYTYK